MKIAVCCSSSSNLDKMYLEHARKVLEPIFQQEHELIFGARNSGIMGVAYQTAKQYNRPITGIATEIDKEDFENSECDTKIITKSITERTERILEQADVLLFLPGGVGTLCELVTAIDKKRSGELDIPILIDNTTGFFDELLQMLQKIYHEQFTVAKVETCYTVLKTETEIVYWFQNFNNK